MQHFMDENSDGLVSAFQYLISATESKGGVLWNTGDKIECLFTTEYLPDTALVSQAIAEKKSINQKNIVCVPVICYGKICFCLQLTEPDDFLLVEEAAQLFEKFASEHPAETVIPEHGKPVISLRDVRKSFTHFGKRTDILKGISFDIYENELLVILGASGTGKTTLMNIIGGLDTADSGSIVVGDLNLAQANAKQLNNYRRNDVGIVFQFYSLIPSLTAEENLRYIAEIVHSDISPQVALGKVGLADVSNHYPSQLSSGQQQRVAIARALIKAPRIILADEPTGALDLTTSKDVLVAMEEIVSTAQGTIVLITHNSEICKIADRVIVMRQGNIDSITVNAHKQSAASLRW